MILEGGVTKRWQAERSSTDNGGEERLPTHHCFNTSHCKYLVLLNYAISNMTSVT